MARVREETQRRGPREGVLRGLAVTGGVITSAGIVLAGTFSALAVLPLVFLTELGFVVAFGVLLDTFLVRSILVPALALDLDRRIWWPSALSKRGATSERPQADAGDRDERGPRRTATTRPGDRRQRRDRARPRRIGLDPRRGDRAGPQRHLRMAGRGGGREALRQARRRRCLRTSG